MNEWTAADISLAEQRWNQSIKIVFATKIVIIVVIVV